MIWDDERFVQMVAYGNAEQRFFRDYGDLFNVVTLPGTVAAFFRQGAGGFVLALDKPYFIDPRTSVLQARFQAEGRDEPRHVRLADAHGPQTAGIFARRALRTGDLSDGLRQEMVESIIAFQVDYAASSSQKLSEYLRYLEKEPETEPLAPHWVTPPYFRASRLDDDWYSASMDMAERALRLDLARPVVPIVCVRKVCLSEDNAHDRIANDWADDFPARLLWLDKLDGYRDPVDDLEAFLDLVVTFRERRARLFNLFGDYFSVMAMRVGLSGVGHGVGYGESREALTRGGGLPAERYYIPALHRHYPPVDAEVMILQVDDSRMICRCEACQRYMVDNELQVSRMGREDLLAHFLMKRRDEIEHVSNTSLDELMNELADIEQLVSGGRFGVDTDHLARWREALTGYDDQPF